MCKVTDEQRMVRRPRRIARWRYAVAVDLRAVTPEMQGREEEQGQLAVMIKMSRRDDQGQAENYCKFDDQVGVCDRPPGREY